MEEIVTELPIKWERWLWRLMESCGGCGGGYGGSGGGGAGL
jgi:hypothetical protein